MPSQLQTEPHISPADYLASEKTAEEKHEYLGGAVYAMAGATREHNQIGNNIVVDLLRQLRGKPCDVFSFDMKVRIRQNAAEFYYYPDVIVDCVGGLPRSHYIEEPRVIFEVLSPETERIDHGEKLRNYQSLDSLQVYALVDQFQIAVTVYRRADASWRREFLTAQNDVLALPEIDCQLSLSAIYERTQLVA